MDSFSVKKAAVTNFLTSVVDRVLGAETAPVVDKKMLNLAQKQANIRAVSVRKGFQQILARSDEMAQRIEQYKQQRSKLPSVECVFTSIAKVLFAESNLPPARNYRPIQDHFLNFLLASRCVHGRGLPASIEPA